MNDAQDTFDMLDALSRTRRLTMKESRKLEAAICVLDGKPPRTVLGRPVEWTPEQDGILCETIANGLSFKTASERLSRTRDACISRFSKIKRLYGDQAA